MCLHDLEVAANLLLPRGSRQEAHIKGGNMIKAFIVAASIVGAAVGTAPAALAAGPYANCTQAHKDGRYDIPQGDPDYWSAGDRDGDGIACES